MSQPPPYPPSGDTPQTPPTPPPAPGTPPTAPPALPGGRPGQPGYGYPACGFSGDEGGSVRGTNEVGDELWEWEFGATYEGAELSVESVIAIHPLVVTATVGSDGSVAGAERVFVIDEEHVAVKHQLGFSTERYLAPCEVEAMSGGQILPFDVLGGQILAYQPASGSAEGLVVAIDPVTEEVSPVMALDPAAREQEYALMGGMMVHNHQPMWHENTLVLANRSFYSGDEDRRALLVYR